MPHGNVRYADRSRSRLAKRANAKVGAKPKPELIKVTPKETFVSAPETKPDVEPEPTTKPEIKKEQADDLGKLNT